MPYRSESQRRWAHTAAGKKALGGEAGVHEWDEATKGKKLPEKVEKSLVLKAPTLHTPSATKMPKAKSMPSAMDKPSKFFKSQDFSNVKHPSIEKLRLFLQNHSQRKQS
jgi:hypothetical protein